MFKNTLDNKRYQTLNYFYKKKFNSKVFKVSIDGNFTCPNKDGKKGYGGCIYCSSNGSSSLLNNKNDDLVTQFNKVKNQLHKKWPQAKYISYFQANTNTYDTLDNLKEKYESILSLKNVIGLSIATRPDAFTHEIYDYLEELNRKTFLTIELGLQTIHEDTLKYINRGHDLECFNKCFKELKKRNIRIVVHIINGLPYETEEMMLKTVKYLNKLNIDGIKIHMLYVTKNTKLYDLYKKENFHILTKEEYINITIKQLEYLNENIVIERITGDPIKEELIEPTWLIKKFCVLNDIDKEMVKRKTYQGLKVNK